MHSVPKFSPVLCGMRMGVRTSAPCPSGHTRGIKVASLTLKNLRGGGGTREHISVLLVIWDIRPECGAMCDVRCAEAQIPASGHSLFRAYNKYASSSLERTGVSSDRLAALYVTGGVCG